MKAIRVLCCVIGLFSLWNCNDDDDGLTLFDNESGRFVRFYLQLDANDVPIEYPETTSNEVPVSSYELNNFNTLKIPVVLSSQTLTEEVTVNFSNTFSTEEHEDIFDILPENNLLTFNGNQLSDTIYVQQTGRISSNDDQLSFKLDSVSDSSIHLGYPRIQNPLSALTVELSETPDYPFQLQNDSIINVQGNLGEQIELRVEFPEGFIEREIDTATLLTEVSSDFEYTLVRRPIASTTEIVYDVTLSEELPGGELSEAILKLNDLRGYIRGNPPELKIVRPPRTYRFQDSIIQIEGKEEETFVFKLQFPDGFDVEDADRLTFFEASNPFVFDHNIIREPITSDTEIEYRFTLNEMLPEQVPFDLFLNLNEVEGYLATTPNTLQISKPATIELSGNPAANFYNVDDPFYRTYGENWMDFNEDGICSWQSFNAFTIPLPVDVDDPNGVQHPNGNYYHRYKVGLVSPNAGRTTNPFNMKRWFNNEATDEENSPGFNISEALEFFPENGDSTTSGFVQVIEQDIIIQSRADNDGNRNTYTVRISGSGTYEELTNGLFEIDLTLQTTNNALFGGTRIAKYKIYNNNSYSDPTEPNEACFQPIDL